MVRTSKTGKSRKVHMNDTVKETLEQLFSLGSVSDSVSGRVYANDKSERLQAVRYDNALDSKAVGAYAREGSSPSLPKL